LPGRSAASKQEALPLFNQRLRLVRLLDEIPALVLRLDHQLRVIWANRWWLQSQEQELNQIQGQDALGLMVSPAQAQALRNRLLEIVQRGGIITTQGLLPEKKGGPPAMVVWRHVAYHDLSGQTEMVSLGRDITHQYETEQALQRSTLQLAQVASLLDRSPLIALRIRFKNGRLVNLEYIRGACQAITGYYPRDFRKNPRLFAKLLAEGWLPKVKSRIAQFAGQGRPGDSLTLEYPITCADGHNRWVEQTMWVSRLLPREEAVELESLVQDTTRRKEAEDSLRQLAAGVAHNFNNLLAAVLSNTQAAIGHVHNQTFELPRLKRLLANVVDSVESGRHLVRRLTAYVGQGDDRKSEKEVVDLAELASTALELARNAWMSKGSSPVEFICHFSSTLSVSAQRGELLEVLLNLVKNALEAMPEGGSLTLVGKKVRARAVLRLSDTGQGMDARTARRVFEPFFSTKGLSGRGLGLSSSRGIVRSYGGELEVSSHPERGTTFTLRLPLCPQIPRVPLEAAPLGRPGKVLLVEDESLVAMGMAAVLEGAGHEVRVAAGVQAALGELSGYKPDVVLCDLGLPDGTGWEVARRLADDGRGQHPAPFVLLTAWAQQENAYAPPAGTSTAWRVLHKPVDRLLLLKTVAEAADGSKSTPAPSAHG